MSSCLEPAPGLHDSKGSKRVETRSTTTVCRMAGHRRHDADRVDAGVVTHDARRYADDGHACRLRHEHGSCRSCTSRHARASGRSHRTLRLLRTVDAYAGGRLGRGDLARAARSAGAFTANGPVTPCAISNPAERESKGTTVARQRLIPRPSAAPLPTSTYQSMCTRASCLRVIGVASG
jgi:hypothetical protein